MFYIFFTERVNFLSQVLSFLVEFHRKKRCFWIWLVFWWCEHRRAVSSLSSIDCFLAHGVRVKYVNNRESTLFVVKERYDVKKSSSNFLG